MKYFVVAAALCLGLSSGVAFFEEDGPVNSRPIIGVLSMEVEPTDLIMYGDYKSHIAASYVKYLESAGARVVPILIHQNVSYYQDIVNSVNGLLFPGGPTFREGMEARFFSRSSRDGSIAEGSGYAEAGYYLLQMAKQANQEGRHFPIWATCIGFQMLTFLEGGLEDYRTPCRGDNLHVPLKFKPDYRSSQIFKNLPEEIEEILRNENVTAHYHNFCVTEESMKERNMLENWRVVATNHDFDGLEFASLIEAKYFPFYGSIFHPEKNGFEWEEDEDTRHDLLAIAQMQFFADFFVTEARKNNHSFESGDAEREALIYNHQPIYTGDKTIYEQVYFFPPSSSSSWNRPLWITFISTGSFLLFSLTM